MIVNRFFEYSKRMCSEGVSKVCINHIAAGVCVTDWQKAYLAPKKIFIFLDNLISVTILFTIPQR